MSPDSDQSLSIAGFIRRYRPDALIYAVFRGGGSGSCFRGLYDRRVPVSEHDLLSLGQPVIPTGAASTRLLLEAGDIKVGCVTLTQSALRVYDKMWAIRAAADVGIPVPQTWRTLAEKPSYPLFFKQSHETGGGARGVARTEQDVPEADRDTLIYQEVIAGSGTYGVGFLAEAGQVLTTHIHFERESLPKEGGSAVMLESFADERLLRYTERLIAALGYSGWGLLEFKHCPRRNDFVFMELNAKFWASCEFAFRNNPRFLKLLFDIDSRETPVRRMIFAERSVARGVLFTVGLLRHLADDCAIMCYPGWSRRAILACLPQFMRQRIRRRRSRM